MAEDMLIEHGSRRGADVTLTIVAGFALGGLIIALIEWEVAILESRFAQFVFFAASLAGCYISARVWHWKGRSYAGGILFGAVLGILGIIPSLLVPRPGAPKPGHSRAIRVCPSCKEDLQRDATKCPHCHDTSQPWTFISGHWATRDDEGNAKWYDERRQTWRTQALV